MRQVLRIIKKSGIPRVQVARDAHVARGTLDAWLAGNRTPKSASLHHLAHGLERRAQVIAELAEEMKRLAEKRAQQEREGE